MHNTSFCRILINRFPNKLTYDKKVKTLHTVHVYLRKLKSEVILF